MCACSVVCDAATPWTIAHQAPLSKEFSRQEYWSGLPFPPSGNLPDPRIEPASPALAGGFFTIESPGKTLQIHRRAMIITYHYTKEVAFQLSCQFFFLNWWWSLVTFCSISQDLFCHRWMWVIVAQLCPTLCNPWTSSRQEHWSGLSFPSPGDHPNPGIEHGSSALQADSLPSETPGKPTSKRHL